MVGELGGANVGVGDVVARCGVSRRTFYELFSGRDDCFLAAFEDALALVSGRVLGAVRGEERWVVRLRVGLVELLRFLDEEPKLGRLLVYESLAGGPVVAARRAEIAGRLAAFVHEGRYESRVGVRVPSLHAEGAVGGVLSILQNHLSSGDGESCLGLAGALMAMLVMPYLGPAAARRELDRPAVAARVSPPVVAGARSVDPFKDAGLRLTYRTARVLLAIADSPGVSNRQVAAAAGIVDQGQVSKLLARLQRAGLLANDTPPSAQGAPNAWTLTGAGRQVTDTVRAHAGTQNGRVA